MSRCPLCQSAAPAHYLGCWHLVTGTPAEQCAKDASVALMAEVRMAHSMEAKKLHNIANKCLDAKTRDLLFERASEHAKLAVAVADTPPIINVQSDRRG